MHDIRPRGLARGIVEQATCVLVGKCRVRVELYAAHLQRLDPHILSALEGLNNRCMIVQ